MVTVIKARIVRTIDSTTKKTTAVHTTRDTSQGHNGDHRRNTLDRIPAKEVILRQVARPTKAIRAAYHHRSRTATLLNRNAPETHIRNRMENMPLRLE